MRSRNLATVCCDDGSTSCLCSAVYTDWTAIALLLFTAVPLAVVVATATFFVLRNKQKAPLG